MMDYTLQGCNAASIELSLPEAGAYMSLIGIVLVLIGFRHDQKYAVIGGYLIYIFSAIGTYGDGCLVPTTKINLMFSASFAVIVVVSCVLIKRWIDRKYPLR